MVRRCGLVPTVRPETSTKDHIMMKDFRSAERERSIGEAIRRVRETRGIKLGVLATRMGMSISMLSMLERGVRHWSLEAITSAADALELQPASLLGDAMEVVRLVELGQSPIIPKDVLNLSVLDPLDAEMLTTLYATMVRRAEAQRSQCQ